MGTDIHTATEICKNGNWTPLGNFEKYEDGWVDHSSQISVGRNYDVFAVLAGVRNGSGFAGVDTGDEVTPISEPKGLPIDVTPEVKEWSDSWGCDGHTHSWLTTREILEHDFTQPKVKRGVVDAVEFLRFEAIGQPTSWSGAVSGARIRHVSNVEMKQLIDQETAGETFWRAKQNAIEKLSPNHEINNVRTQVEWSITQAQACSGFLIDTLPHLLKLGNFDQTRLVFFFDN